MERTMRIITGLSAMALCALMVSSGRAQTVSPDALSTPNEIDVGQKRVTLEISQGTVSDALLSLSKQADLELAVSADQADLQKTFTLLVKDKPASDVLEIITATTNLDMEMTRGVLIVRSKKAEASKTSLVDDTSDTLDTPPENDEERADNKPGFKTWRERFDEHKRYWRKRKKRVELGAPVMVGKKDHLQTAVSIGADTTIEGHVDRDAVSVGGTVRVKSGAVVEGSAVSIGGKVIIEPGAVVGDDAVAVGGTVEVAEKAVLEGDRVSIGIPMPHIGGIAGAIGGILLLNVLGAIARSVILFAIALLLLWLLPKRVDAVKRYMSTKPGVSILSGFLLFIALVPLFIVLALTVIGIPLIPVAALVLVALMLIGYTSLFTWLGERTPIFKENKTPIKAIILGFLVFLLINIVPVIGGIFLIISAFAAVGATFQSRFGGREAV